MKWGLAIATAVLALQPQGQCLDLLERYPTALVAGDTSPERARAWDFGEKDVFQISGFKLQVAELRIDIGPADLGIGHSEDGAVWAIVLPRAGGSLNSPSAQQPERIAHLWLRFHPKILRRLFANDTVLGAGATNLLAQMQVIARSKFSSSWHAGWNAMIPEPKDLTVDLDTVGGPRRFFAVDSEASTARYISAFEDRQVRIPPAFAAALAEEAFDRLWNAFDRDYAMFALRPEVDWEQLRQQ